MSEFRKVIHKPGELLDFETIFEENPYLRTGVPKKKGTVERVDYETSVYEDGNTYPKYCYVYLPYGYDPEDKAKKYNVLYFQHGNTCEPSIFSIGGNKPMFDMLFDSGDREPCIIVSTTYYIDPMRYADERVKTGMIPAGDGMWPGIPNNFHREVVECIIPAVEMRFNTYLTDPSPEGIKATRDHRGFCGYSRGCGMTWNMIHRAFPYFRWFAPMSGGSRAGKKRGEPVTDEELIAYQTEPMKADPELPFFIYASNGGPEDIKDMHKLINLMAHDPVFSYGNDPKKNNLYFSVSDFYHTDYLVPYYLWNSLTVLFQGLE